MPKHNKEKPNFRIIETKSVDQFDKFLELYNEFVPREEIMERLNIKRYTYYKYFRKAKKEGLIIEEHTSIDRNHTPKIAKIIEERKKREEEDGLN